ncbi:unnamed protein product [Rotaria magnacalcarata]|uniref:Uncharacterized protein n=1 Tax=Rotaria magnacalcarata TaxID=392030 RepID=A0A816MT91_9BILA|nr:unnamed protein product [Rotaria magnacalcarata]
MRKATEFYLTPPKYHTKDLVKVYTDDDISHERLSADQAIVKSFVPDNLGFGHVTPQDVIGRHTTAIARELMCGGDSTDTEIIIIDGTYLYIQAGGARFHGCRSHISLAIWFLTHQQWQTQQRHMPSVECKNLATDSIQISDFYDSSDDDDSQPYSLA